MMGGYTTDVKSETGFTVVEVMIFLAVSSIIFISAMNLLSGKEGKTEFSTGLGTLTSQLQSYINNVSSGYYNVPDNTTCSVVSNMPVVTLGAAGSSTLGTNEACTFIGDIIAFGDQSSANESYTVYPVSGLHYATGTTKEATSLADADPYAAAVVKTQVSMPYGLSISKVSYTGIGSVTLPVGAIGFFTTFNQYYGLSATSSSSQLHSGGQHIQIVPIPGTTLSDNNPDLHVAGYVNSQLLTDAGCIPSGSVCYVKSKLTTASINPASGINICVNSGTTQQSAQLTLGGLLSGSTITSQIFSRLNCV